MGSGYITESTEKKAAFAPSPGFPGYVPDVPSGGYPGPGANHGWGSSISNPNPSTVAPGIGSWRMPPLGPAGAFIRAAQELEEALNREAAEDNPERIGPISARRAPPGFELQNCACGGDFDGFRAGTFVSYNCSTNVWSYPHINYPANGWNPTTNLGGNITTWRFSNHFSGNNASWWRVCHYVKTDARTTFPGEGTMPAAGTGTDGAIPIHGRWGRYPSRIVIFEETSPHHEPVGTPGPQPAKLPFKWWADQPNHAPDGTPTRWNDPARPPQERPWVGAPWNIPHPSRWPGPGAETAPGPWPGFGKPHTPGQWPSRTVTLTIAGNGRFSITGRPSIHNRNFDPKKGPKMMVGPIIAAIAKKTGLAAATEGCDTIENAYDALPRKYKRRTWKGSGPTPKGWRKKKISCTAQARQVGKYLSEINGMQSKAKQTVIDEFVKNFVRSQALDFAIGRASRAAGKGLNKMGYRGSSTFGTGPGATGQGWGAGD